MTTDSSSLEVYFTRADGAYLFARWGRPIVPVVIGVDDATLGVVKGAIEAVVALAQHEMAETDPELGVNLMLLFFRDWRELLDTPGLDQLVPELANLVPKLEAANANQYRLFRFDAEGAIQACFGFVRMDETLQDVPAEALSLSIAVQSILLWSDTAFRDTSPLANTDDGLTVLKPEIAEIVRAAYDPILSNVADDSSHALRLTARLDSGQ